LLFNAQDLEKENELFSDVITAVILHIPTEFFTVFHKKSARHNQKPIFKKGARLRFYKQLNPADAKNRNKIYHLTL